MARQHPASRGQVLDAIRARSAVSRAELAEITGLTQATISNVVRLLLEEGLVAETGEREYTGGKPRVMLSLQPRARCGVGIQLGADWIIVVLADALGNVIARSRVRGGRNETAPDTLGYIADVLEQLLVTADLQRDRIVGIGLAAPGLLDVERGMILRSRSLASWAGFPMREELARATGFPVFIDNDATCAAIGEFWGGTSGDAQAHCTVHMGASVGAGIVLAGAVYRGASSNTGAIGHLAVHRGNIWRGRTIEELVTPRAVAERARSVIASGAVTSVTLSPDGDWIADFTAVATAAVHGDELAIGLIRESAEYLADAVVTLANILDLDSIVLAGPAFATAGTIYLTHVREHLDREFFAADRHPIEVRLSDQVVDAAAVGAASLVLQRELAPR